MTEYEKYFYNILIELEKEYYIKVQPQINLATIISGYPNNKEYVINRIKKELNLK